MVYLTSDHAGFELKLKLLKSLLNHNIAVEDLGPFEYNPNDDYSDFVGPAVEKVLEDESNVAVLICRNGVGMNIAANKYKGIRATLSWNKDHAISSKLNDNTNILTLPADFISPEEAFDTANRWIHAKFSNEERHNRRINKLKELE